MEHMVEGLVVIGKLGIMASEPVGLYDDLAEHFDADQHVAEDIHGALYGNHRIEDTKKMAVVNSVMLERTQTSLLNGISVIYDNYLNKQPIRQTVLDLATTLGALVILVHTRTKMAVIKERVRIRYAHDYLYVPSGETTAGRQIGAAAEMAVHFKYGDNPDRGNIPHFCVDGLLPCEAVIPLLDEYIAGRRAS